MIATCASCDVGEHPHQLVQRALNHANIKTTTRYAHVLDEEVAALEQVQRATGAETSSRLLQAGTMKVPKKIPK
jgi:hypothetical protein